MSKLTCLIVGGGSIGRRHIGNLQKLGYPNIYVLKREADPAFASKHRVEVITSFDQAADLSLDCVFVCSPTSLHNESLAFAAKHGLHVFMEKPLIHSPEGLREAQSIMKDYQGVFFIGFMLRYHPLVVKLRALLNTSGLGQVYSARFSFGSFLPYWHPWEDYKISYASRKELGGGVINTITHELDLIQACFGAPDKVYCEASNFGRLDIPVEEHCEAIFSYSDKVITLHLDYLQKDYDRNILILGENGKIRWDWHDNSLTLKLHKQDVQLVKQQESFEVNQLYLDELQDFFQLIAQHKRQHDLDFQHAVANTELTLLMHESAQQGRKLSYESR